MSILETFYLLFKADTTDAEKGAKRVDKIQDEAAAREKKRAEAGGKRQEVSKRDMENLEDQLKRNEEAAQGLGSSFVDLAADTAVFLAGLVSIGAIGKGILGTEQQSLELKRFSDELGLNIQEVSAWGNAQKQTGGDVQDLMSNVKTLNQSLNLMQQSYGGQVLAATMNDFTRNLQNNGIELLDNSGKIKNWSAILMDEARMMERMPKQQAFNFSTRLGNSEQLTRFLQQGTKAIQEQIAEQFKLGVVTDESAAKAAKFAREWGDLTSSLDAAGRAMGGPILDFLTNLPTMIADSTLDLKSLAQAVIAVTGVFSILYIEAAVAFGAIIVGAIVALSPFILFGVAVLAVYELIKHLGDIAPWLGKAFQSAFTGIKSVVSETIEILKDLWNWQFKVIRAFEAFGSGGSIKERIAKFKAVFSEDEKKHSDSVFGPPQPTPIQNEKDKAERRSDLMPSSGDMMAAAKASIAVATQTPISSQTRSSILGGAQNQSTTVHIDKVEVSTQATNADGIAQELGLTLQQHLTKAIMNTDTGRRA